MSPRECVTCWHACTCVLVHMHGNKQNRNPLIKTFVHSASRKALYLKEVCVTTLIYTYLNLNHVSEALRNPRSHTYTIYFSDTLHAHTHTHTNISRLLAQAYTGLLYMCIMQKHSHPSLFPQHDWHHPFQTNCCNTHSHKLLQGVMPPLHMNCQSLHFTLSYPSYPPPNSLLFVNYVSPRKDASALR